MYTCKSCGYKASFDWVNMWDYCPWCKESPFPEKRDPHEDDQPDAMNQGVHIALWRTTEGLIGCECGATVFCEAWEMHCEGEGE